MTVGVRRLGVWGGFLSGLAGMVCPASGSASDGLRAPRRPRHLLGGSLVTDRLGAARRHLCFVKGLGMNVLVDCKCNGTVRDAFLAQTRLQNLSGSALPDMTLDVQDWWSELIFWLTSRE